ncbi:MAG: hypothetical protein ACE5FU_01710 [Nitrospinota bacterium]
MSGSIKQLMTKGQSRIQKASTTQAEKKNLQAPPLAAPTVDQSFVAKNIPGWKRESLDIVLKNTITPGQLKTLTTLSEKKKYLLNEMKGLETSEVDILFKLIRDKANLRTKLTLLAAWNSFAKNGPIQKGFSRVGGLFSKIQLPQK